MARPLLHPRAAMQVHGLDSLRPTTLRAGLVIVFDAPVPHKTLVNMRDRLIQLGVLEPSDEDDAQEGSQADADDSVLAPESAQFLTGIWQPRTNEEVQAGLAALESLPGEHGGSEAWLWTVNTAIDLVEGHDDDTLGDWQHGLPPQAESTRFPLERYPEIFELFEGDDFGIALKLAGPARPGEAEVLSLAHHLWVCHYVDPRADERPFRHARADFDAAHRSALLWVDRFSPPATLPEMVHHLMAVTHAIDAVVPIHHARFDEASPARKYAALTGAEAEPILAGNPLRTPLAEGGLSQAALWAENQRAWLPTEVAAMYVELGCEQDPDDGESGALGVALFERAQTLDASNDEARNYAQVARVRSGAINEALELARSSDVALLRALTADLVGDHAPDRFADAFAILDAAALDDASEQLIVDIIKHVVNLAPDALETILATVPREPRMMQPLEVAAHELEDKHQSLTLLKFIVEMPKPAQDEGDARQAFVRVHNSGIVNAQTLGKLDVARWFSDRAVQYAEENPYIFHSAACIYALQGELDTAMSLVEGAFAHNYDRLETLVDDDDLAGLMARPRWQELVGGYRARMARIEPIVDADAESFPAAVLGREGTVLVDFHATWCGPCKRQAPILEQFLRRSDGSVRIVKVDIDEAEDLAERYDATSVPTLLVFRGGEEVGRAVGLTDLDGLTALLA